MSRSLSLGIDIGTTATKVVLIDATGVIAAVVSRPATVSGGAPGHAEMDPMQWWGNLTELIPAALEIARASPRDVGVIGVSGMVPTLVAVDQELVPLHPSIQQNDARAVEEIDRLAAALPDALARSGSAVTAQSIGPKWQWLCRNRPEVSARTRTILGSYGWVVARMTGRLVADENWSLESGLTSIGQGWDPEICAAVDLPAALLPEIVASNDAVGQLLPGPADELGLLPGTPVTGGYADHVVSAFAAGLLSPGDTLIKLGGAGDILTVTAEPVLDARLFLDHHPITGLWLPNGCMATSGSLLRWFQTELAGGRELVDLDHDASAVGAGSGGILALPYFLGEKTPVQDPLARGAFVGLHQGHTRAHLFRALIEAVAFGFAHHLEVLEERGVPVDNIRVTNGGSRSALFKQSVADVTGRRLASVASHPGSSWGAGLLAAGAAGLLDPVEAVQRLAQVEEWFEPEPMAHQLLQRQYQRYGQLRTALAPISHAIAGETWGQS